MASNHPPGDGLGDREVLHAVVDVLVLGEPLVLSIWQASDLTLTQIRVLRAIQRACSSASALAQDVGIPPSSLSRVLERLEQRGLVVRDVDHEDRRRIRIAVTAEGERFLGTLAAADWGALGRAVAALGRDDREALVRGAAALLAASRGLGEPEGPAGPRRAPTVAQANATKEGPHGVPGR